MLPHMQVYDFIDLYMLRVLGILIFMHENWYNKIERTPHQKNRELRKNH